MAFPGTFNISYYKGDTYEFNIYPKDSNGQPFNLSNYSVAFTVANRRGANPETSINAYAVITADSVIRCVIPPLDAAVLDAGTTYVYDVQITNELEDLPYPIVYTVLTGNISVSEQVTGA